MLSRIQQKHYDLYSALNRWRKEPTDGLGDELARRVDDALAQGVIDAEEWERLGREILAELNTATHTYGQNSTSTFTHHGS